MALTRQSKVPAVKFWKEAAATERATALDQWRAAAYGEVPPLNRPVLDFALANYGKKVDRGQCSDLAVAALGFAKAQPIRYEGKTYIWGMPVAKADSGLPGDIVQIEDAHFSPGEVIFHHTQIIRRVLGPGHYEVLEQNAGGRLTVGADTLDLNRLTKGSVVLYRPLPLKASP